jgi:protein-disulfide isomerase
MRIVERIRELPTMKKVLLAMFTVAIVALPVWLNANAETAEELALKIGPNEHVLGSADAPVEIIEYMSTTCPHCAHFHLAVLPDLKKEYIDTGKVKFVIRDLPWDALAFAVSKIAHCAEDNYHEMLDLFMNTQKAWTRSEDALKEVKKVARMGGMSSVDVDACLRAEDVHKKVNLSRKTALDVLKVNGTPTLFVNGQKLSGGVEMDELRKTIDSLL